MAEPTFGMSETVAVATAGGLAVVLATRRVRDYLLRREILDRPNERSSHTMPTPRGGGLATTPVLSALLLLLAWKLASPLLCVLSLGALALLAISWLDDRRSLPALPRFLVQLAAVCAFLILAVPAQSAVFGGILPLWLDRALTALAWLWFINLYNFMDGIDGITGCETISLGSGIAAVSALIALPEASDILPASMAIAAIGGGFLIWNWHPAKIFLGDSGSIPLGYILGGLLLWLALHGYLAAALILPGYYLCDATITLIRRAINREAVWKPHRKHFYQRAVQGGKRHDQVVLAIAVANAGLIATALWSTRQPLAALAISALVVGVVLVVLVRWAGGRGA